MNGDEKGKSDHREEPLIEKIWSHPIVEFFLSMLGCQNDEVEACVKKFVASGVLLLLMGYCFFTAAVQLSYFFKTGDYVHLVYASLEFLIFLIWMFDFLILLCLKTLWLFVFFWAVFVPFYSLINYFSYGTGLNSSGSILIYLTMCFVIMLDLKYSFFYVPYGLCFLITMFIFDGVKQPIIVNTTSSLMHQNLSLFALFCTIFSTALSKHLYNSGIRESLSELAESVCTLDLPKTFKFGKSSSVITSSIRAIANNVKQYKCFLPTQLVNGDIIWDEDGNPLFDNLEYFDENESDVDSKKPSLVRFAEEFRGEMINLRSFGRCMDKNDISYMVCHVPLLTTLKSMAVVEIHNFYFEPIMEIVQSHGGDVIDISNDDIIVTFNAIRSCDDPCVQSCLTALALTDYFNQDLDDDGNPTLKIAIASGDAITGHFGNADFKRFNVLGSVVSRVNHMRLLLQPSYTVIIDENTQLNLKNEFKLRIVEFSEDLDCFVYELGLRIIKKGGSLGKRGKDSAYQIQVDSSHSEHPQSQETEMLMEGEEEDKYSQAWEFYKKKEYGKSFDFLNSLKNDSNEDVQRLETRLNEKMGFLKTLNPGGNSLPTTTSTQF